MGAGAVIDAAKGLTAGPMDAVNKVTDKAESMASDAGDAIIAGAKAVGNYFAPNPVPSPDQAYAARQSANQDAADGRAILAQHPELLDEVRGGANSVPPSDGSTPSTGDYHGTDLLGNPVTVPAAQRGEAASGALTGLDPKFAAAHPNVATVHNLLPLIGMAMGLGKMVSGGMAARAAESVAGEGAAASAPMDIAGKSSNSPNLPNTSEHFQSMLDHPDANSKFKAAVNELKPAIRDPDTGEVYLADDPTAKNHYQVFGDLPKDVADKPQLDSGFVGADNEYMTRQQAADHLIAAQATGTPRSVTPELVTGPSAMSDAARPVGESGGLTGFARGSISDKELTPEELAAKRQAAGAAVTDVAASASGGQITAPSAAPGSHLTPYTLQALENDRPTSAAAGATEAGPAATVGSGAEPATPAATEAATPAAAAQTLAEKQIANLKAARVGTGTATAFGHPEIATTVPESLTMEEAQGLRQSLESYYAQGSEPPKLAAHVQALATTYQEEAMSMWAHNQELRARAWNGEDVTPQLEELKNRFSAAAQHYSTLAGTQSDVGRSLQILDPNKPGNSFVGAVAHLAQEFSIENNPEQLSDLMAQMKPEQYFRVGRQMATDVSMGRSLYNGLHEYYVDNLLSNPGRTSARIGVSSSTSGLLTLPIRQIAAMIPGSPYKMGEPLAGIQGLMDGFWHSIDVALESAKTDRQTSQIERGTIDSGSPFGDRPKAISAQAFGLGSADPDTGDFKATGFGTGIDYLGSVLRLGPRGLTAVHQFYHSMAGSMFDHMNAWRGAVDQAAGEGASGLSGYSRASDIYRSTLQDLPPEIRNASGKEADVTTFVNKLEDGSLPGLAQQATQFPVLKQLLPFFKVAYNVKKFGADITPILGGITQAPDLLWGSAAERSTAIAKQTFGAAMALAVAHEYHQGNITLDKYDKPQFKFGDTLVDVPPGLDFPVGVVGKFLQQRDQMDDPTALRQAAAAATAVASATANDSIVQGLVNIKHLWSDIASGDPSALEKFAGSEASGLVPFSSLLRALKTGTDPYQRDPKTFGEQINAGIPDNVVNAVGAARGAIGLNPTMAQAQPKYDVFNEPVPNPTLGLPQKLLYPVNITKAETRPLEKDMAAVGAQAARVPDVIFGRKQRISDNANNPDVGVPLDGGALEGPDHEAWSKARAEDLRSELDDYFRDAKNDSELLRKQTYDHIMANHAKLATQSMLDIPRISKLYDARMDRKADSLLSPDEMAPALSMPPSPEASAGGAP